ncbi:d-lactate dehydrogenase [Cladorrhinum sp. PSN332]|nr:d-lactate dehydrogenase [Cladorrhinum sp. PSN332]
MSFKSHKLKLAIFSAKAYDKDYFTRVHSSSHLKSSIELIFHDFALSEETVPLAQGASAVCVFVNDILTEIVLKELQKIDVRAIMLRCAGYNSVDLVAAEKLSLSVANVPSYSPEAVAEFAVTLMQTLNRKTHRAYNRVREGNFDLNGLLGKTLHGKTVGIVGTGKIGIATARILRGFGCRLLAYDPYPIDAFGEFGDYTNLQDLLPQCDFISLHCPLTDATRHVINEQTLKLVKPGAMLINTSRGGLIDTESVIAALKSKRLGGLALDVYEAEAQLFYKDHGAEIIQDDELMRLLTFPNVLICGHQAFFTEEALTEIAECTLRNVEDFMLRRSCPNSLVREGEGRLLVRKNSLPVRM